LQRYLREGQTLPPWADRVKIERAEVLFMDYGALSCTLLFCASLPECYVIPDLSAVLHAAGQLEQHTDYRIRSTAAMIFPVMMKGGLGQPGGSGVAQILKVRLIHATIRNLLLRGAPADVLAALGDQLHVASAGVVPPLASLAATNEPHKRGMHDVLLTHGWRVGADGLPCNQEELAYTLLTFGYVFLRSMRQLGLGLSASDEEAYLHCWNVVGHVLGIRRELLVDTMAQAEALLAQMQARGRARPWLPDPRPALGSALMDTMVKAIPFTVLKGFPVLMTRYLCGTITSREIGVSEYVSSVTYLLFVLAMGLTRAIDTVIRWVIPEFSIARFFTRVVGYHLMSRVLLDQTRPLKLPDHLLNEVSKAMGPWSEDVKAPAWLNAIEDRLTQHGAWTARGEER
jgi:ER-bound oxygenase mpaB/B'/Rubber oxygenase, catalytic domain